MSKLPQYIGRFPILDILGEGGMGVVYLAKDPDIGRKVAIKVLQSRGNPGELERFKNEARTIGEFSHPNIVMLLECGVDQNHPFLVLEFLEGPSLQQWISTPHTLAEHKSILLDLCNALEYAHDKGVLHRDLKPGNVQVLPSGQAKLLDFGIAQGQDSNLTVSGMVLGTPKFLAPEVLQDGRHTRETDCYSLGILCYSMFSGENPFAATNFQAAMHKQLTLVPRPLNDLNRAIPLELSKVIDQYLAKDPDIRPRTPALLREALQKITSERQLNAVIVPESHREQVSYDGETIAMAIPQDRVSGTLVTGAKLPVLAGLAALLIAGAVYYRMSIDDAKAPPARLETQQVAIPLPETPTESPLDLGATATSEDGSVAENIATGGQDGKDAISVVATPEFTPSKTNQESAKPLSEALDSPPVSPAIQDKPVPPAVDKSPPAKVVGVAAERPVQPVTAVVVEQPVARSVEQPGAVESPVTAQPAFALPSFNTDRDKLKIAAVEGASLSRGKTQDIILRTPGDAHLDRFQVFKGKTEFPDIKIIDAIRQGDGLVRVTVYISSNAMMGEYQLFAYQNNKRSNPIIIEVTL